MQFLMYGKGEDQTLRSLGALLHLYHQLMLFYLKIGLWKIKTGVNTPWSKQKQQSLFKPEPPTADELFNIIKEIYILEIWW